MVMSQVRGREFRLLGSVRQSTTLNRPLQLCPIKIDATYEGISGNAIYIPPPTLHNQASVQRRNSTNGQRQQEQEENQAPVISKIREKSQPTTSRRDGKILRELNDKNKQLKEFQDREKELHDQLSELRQLVDSLRSEVEQKETIIGDLDNRLQAQEEKYKSLFEKEKTSHALTKENLEKVETALAEKVHIVEDLKVQHDLQLKDTAVAFNKCQSELVELKSLKEKELKSRDEKLERMKQQMADALKGNSWERYQQLEELGNELVKVQEEADLLRNKLRNLQKTSKESCSNCDRLQEKIVKMSATTTMKEKEKDERNNNSKNPKTLFDNSKSKTKSSK